MKHLPVIPSIALFLVVPCHTFTCSSFNTNTYPAFSQCIRNSHLDAPTGRLFAVEPESSSQSEEEKDTTGSSDKKAEESPASGQYDVSKLVSSEGAGFNQFDPVLKATGFLSRRFGIAGGLAVFAALVAVEGGEIVRSFNDQTPTAGSGETITKPSGLKVTEFQIGKGGASPLPGSVIGLNAVVKVGDKVIYDTTAEGSKPVAFKLGQRPFQNVICVGVEEGITGMKVGGKRRLDVPQDMGPPGVSLPPGVPLTYEIELTEVLPGYF